LPLRQPVVKYLLRLNFFRRRKRLFFFFYQKEGSRTYFLIPNLIANTANDKTIIQKPKNLAE